MGANSQVKGGGECVKKSVRSSASMFSGSLRPFRIKAGAVIKRFLCTHASRRQSRVQIRAAHGFLLGDSFAKEYGEAADEGIARASAVNGVDHERRHVFAAVAA